MQYIHNERLDGKIGLQLDLGNIVIPELVGKEILLEFPIKTYTKVCKNGTLDDEESSFKAINNFFDWLSEDDKRIIIIYLATMHQVIRERIGGGVMENIIDLSQELGKMVLSLNDNIALYDKLVKFSDEHIPINLFKGAGQRPQDTPLRTYYYDDIVKLMACVLLSKMLAPIFGTIMHYSTKFGIESRLKEMHCLPILTPFYQTMCPDVIFKLKEYIKPILAKEFTEDTDSISIGLTKNSIANHVFVNLVIRNFINIDIYRENSNHITAIRVGIKKAIDTQRSMMKTHRVMVRQDMSSIPDDQKRSQLEVDSVVSHNTADIPAIAEAFVGKVITGFLREYEIPRELYDACYKHNLNTYVTYNVLNKLIIELLFSSSFSGSTSLKYLHIDSMTKLITTAQLITASLGYSEVSHAITAQSSMLIKGTMSDIDQAILIGYQHKQQYRIYQTRLLESSLGSDCLSTFFNKRINDIVSSITSDTHVFNSAPELWDSFKQENVNNKVIQFSEEYINELCAFFNCIWPDE